MTKKQSVKSIKEMFEKMLPVFKDSWSEDYLKEDFVFRTYRGSCNYGSIAITIDEDEINLTYSNKKITISQTLGKEISSKLLHELVEKIFKATFSFETLSSEEYQSIKKIREIKKSISNLKKEIIRLEDHRKNIKTLKK